MVWQYMDNAFDQFKANIQRVRNLGALNRALKATTTNALDLSDILRAELVLAVSALDYYVHETVRLCMQETYKGNRAMTPSFLRFNISMERALQGFLGKGFEDDENPKQNNENVDWLDSEIRLRHGWQSFQRADKIAEAIRLISNEQLWPRVAELLEKDSQDIKRTLDLIVDRRNQIAHESDMDPTSIDSRWPIDESMVDESIDFIEQITEAISKVVSDDVPK